jgi:hypothetical protein
MVILSKIKLNAKQCMSDEIKNGILISKAAICVERINLSCHDTISANGATLLSWLAYCGLLGGHRHPPTAAASTAW